MIDHAQALTLAATAIDFQLSATERSNLDAHLRDCSVCRAERVALQHDAARLAGLPAIAPPGWVRGTIGKRGGSNRLVLLVAAALLITASAGVAVVGSILREDRTAVVTPSATPRGTVAIPSPSTASHQTVHCGPLDADITTCFQIVGATAGGLSSDLPRDLITDIFVTNGSRYQWCAPPLPCVSAPPESYWVEFQWSGGWERVPVYSDSAGGGWLLGVPPEQLAEFSPQPS